MQGQEEQMLARIQAQQQAQQDALKNQMVFNIFILQKEKERLENIKSKQGIMGRINYLRMSFFDQKNLNNIESLINQIDRSIVYLKNSLSDISTQDDAFAKINQTAPYVVELINKEGKPKKNKIALILLGTILAGLSIAVGVLTFGAATLLITGFYTTAFSLGVAATAWGAKSIHDDKKAILKIKIDNKVIPTWFERHFYKKMTRDILLQAKGENKFTEFQEQLYRQIDTEYDLRKKIDEGTPLTRTEKFFHKSMIRRILQEKIDNGDQLSEYANDLCQEFNINTNQIEQETDEGLPLSDLGGDNPNNLPSITTRTNNAQRAANQNLQAGITTPLLQPDNQPNSHEVPE